MSSIQDFSELYPTSFDAESVPFKFDEDFDSYYKKEFARFCHIEGAEGWLKNDHASGQRCTQFFKTLSKIITVISAIISILMPFAMAYCPVWVPFGIGLPSLLILPFLNFKLQDWIVSYKRDREFVPYFREFLKQHNVQALHPIGAWDLSEKDKRLKSDEMMVLLKLNKKHPQSAKEITDVINKYDLDLSPFVQKYAACHCADNTKMENRWSAVQNTLCDAKAHLYEGAEKYFKKMRKKAFALAYGKAQNISYDKLDFPAVTVRQKIESIVIMYHQFRKTYLELHELVEEGEYLYGSKKNFDEKHWVKFEEGAEKVNFLALYLEDLLNDPQTSPNAFLQALSDIKRSHLKLSLFNLCESAQELKMEVKEWIEAHPKRELQAFEEKMAEMGALRILTVRQLKILQRWINTHPNKSEESCDTLLKSKVLPTEIVWWLMLKQNSSKRSLTVKDLFDHCCRKRQALGLEDVREWVEAQPDWRQQNRELPSVQENLIELKTRTILSPMQLNILKRWNVKNPNLREQKCIKILEDLPIKIRLWLEVNPDMQLLTAEELFQKSSAMRDAFNRAKKQLFQLQKKISGIDSQGAYTDLKEELNRFNQDVIAPLCILIAQCGETSKAKLWREALPKKMPTVPFEKGDLTLDVSLEEPLRHRKIQEIHLNKMLQQVDAKMLHMNRMHAVAVRLPIILLLIVQAVFTLYFVSPWVTLGFVMLTMMGEGISFYINYRLKLVEKEKLTNKFEHILLNHPDIGAIPGTRSRLADLKRVQGQYGLDGVGPTWARTLAEGNQILIEPKDVESAKPILRKICEKGSKKAANYLAKHSVTETEVNESHDPNDAIENSIYELLSGREVKIRISELVDAFGIKKLDADYLFGEAYQRAIKLVQRGSLAWDTEENALASIMKVIDQIIYEGLIEKGLIEEILADDALQKQGVDHIDTFGIEGLDRDNLPQEAKRRIVTLVQGFTLAWNTEKDVFISIMKVIDQIFYEQLSRTRNEVDKKLDHMAEEMIAYAFKLKEYASVFKRIEAMESKMQTLSKEIVSAVETEITYEIKEKHQEFLRAQRVLERYENDPVFGRGKEGIAIALGQIVTLMKSLEYKKIPLQEEYYQLSVKMILLQTYEDFDNQKMMLEDVTMTWQEKYDQLMETSTIIDDLRERTPFSKKERFDSEEHSF